MPTILYGPRGNFDLESFHVLAALIREFHEAKETEVELVKVWCKDINICELAELIRSVVDFSGRLEFDPSKPDGTPCKLLDRLKLNDLG